MTPSSLHTRGSLRISQCAVSQAIGVVPDLEVEADLADDQGPHEGTAVVLGANLLGRGHMTAESPGQNPRAEATPEQDLELGRDERLLSDLLLTE